MIVMRMPSLADEMECLPIRDRGITEDQPRVVVNKVLTPELRRIYKREQMRKYRARLR